MDKQVDNEKAYKVELGPMVVGWSMKTVYSNPNIVAEDIRLIAPKDNRTGISAERAVVWFDGIRQGKTFVDIIAVSTQGNIRQTKDRFWLCVDSNLNVTRIEGDEPYSAQEAINGRIENIAQKWICPICGSASEYKFCNECGANKPAK